MDNSTDTNQIGSNMSTLLLDITGVLLLILLLAFTIFILAGLSLFLKEVWDEWND